MTIGENGSRIDSAKVRTDSLTFYVSGVPYNAYKNTPSGGGTTTISGLFDLDPLGGLMPVLTALLDNYWELDVNGDIMPKAI